MRPPLFLRPDRRFIMDSKRSPRWPATAMAAPNAIAVTTWARRIAARIAQARDAQTTPPQNPAQVLFGESLGASLGPPIKLPLIKAPVSVAQTATKNMTTSHKG